MGSSLHDLRFSNGLRRDTKKMRTKEKKVISWASSKDICVSKDIINKVKKHPTEWEEIYAKHISAKSSVSGRERYLSPRNMCEGV